MRSWIILGTIVVSVCGCGGPSEPGTYEVSGAVTWEGKPLEEGDILLAAPDGAGVPTFGKIKDGTYRVWSPPGKKLVSIRASRLVPGSKGAMDEPIFDNFIPDRYNARTTLTAEVTSDQRNRFDYSLEPARPTRGK
jgi:hypothetical protein